MLRIATVTAATPAIDGRREGLRIARDFVAGGLRIVDRARHEQSHSAEFVSGAMVALANIERALILAETSPGEDIRWQWNLHP